ncbi:MAG TPA: nucleotidyltransferase family protein, partial [Terriglobales bacterium]
MSFQRTKSLRSAILHSFYAVKDAQAADRLREFSERDWRKLGSWMQASGIGLYFLAELGKRGIKHAIPEEILRGLSQNLADNRERNAALRSELVRLNAAFRESGLDFLNVKG